MAFQDRKNELIRKLNSLQLMDNYRANQEKLKNPMGSAIGLGKNIYDGFRSLSQPAQPNAEFMGKIGAELPQGANFTTPANSIQGLGSTSLNTQAMPTNTIGNAAEGASQATGALSNVGSTIGKAAPIVGTAFGAKNAIDSFRNGDTVGGALDATTAIAPFIPGVGWAIAGAAQIGKIFNNIFGSHKQEAMRKSQEEAAKSQKLSAETLANQRQGFDEVKQENMQKMQNQMENMNQPQDNSQVIANLMNQFKATQEQPMYQQVPQQTEQVAQNNNNALVQDILGQVTGGASGVQQPMMVDNFGSSQGYSGQLPDLTQAPTNYAEENAPALSYDGGATQALDEQKQSLMDKFRAGLSDFNAGYQDNANTDFAHGDLMNKVTGGAAPTQSPDGTHNLSAVENKKSIMARLGELAGTGQRIMAHPLTQAAIAGGISRAAGGDIDDMAKAAFQYGSQKAAADRYYQQVTGNTNRPFINTYSPYDVTNKRLEEQMKQKQDQYEQGRQDKLSQQEWERNYKINKDKEDRAIKREEVAARKKYWETRGNNDRGNSVAQQKYEYQQGLNKSIGQFQKYADALNKAKEKDGWFANSNDKDAIEKAQKDYDKAREFMINTYGGDFIKYAKEQGWE